MTKKTPTSFIVATFTCLCPGSTVEDSLWVVPIEMVYAKRVDGLDFIATGIPCPLCLVRLLVAHDVKGMEYHDDTVTELLQAKDQIRYLKRKAKSH
jgi:hypothetical protein